MFTITSVKANFFDRLAVLDAVDAATRKVLSKFGAWVMTRSRRSIRKRKGTSLPGGPPFSHVGTLRGGIFFAYDKLAASVVIGPMLIAKPSGAPETLEYGGSTVFTVRHGRVTKVLKRPKTVKIEKRPYMKPAFDSTLRDLPNMWSGSVKR